MIGYLAERINLPKLLKLKHPDIDDGDQWTPFDICEGRLFVLDTKVLKPPPPPLWFPIMKVLVFFHLGH